MDNIKIIVFLCNWGPHAAFQTMQENHDQIPPEVKMVRIPCIGRISKALLFKAFEMGADGVALVGCQSGGCRYGSGTVNGEINTADTRKIIELLGLGKERMRLATFLPDQVEKLHNFLTSFSLDIKQMGPSPILPDAPFKAHSLSFEKISGILTKYNAYGCQDCGKCTSACPLALSGKTYSPRLLVNAIIGGELESEAVKQDIWSCLTCGLCYQICPSDVNFPAFIGDLRAEIFYADNSERHQAHGGFFQSLMRSMTTPALKPQTHQSIPEDVEIDQKSDTLFFGGCGPYFDVFFQNHYRVNSSSIIHDGLRLLNFFDIKPGIMEHERCCGHDLLWTGDHRNFLKLARLNVEAIKRRGIKELITACPECYRTIAYDYPKYGIDVDFKVTHLYEILENEIDKGAVAFKTLDQKITYQDACRLNSSPEIKDLPGKLLSRIKTRDLAEENIHQQTSVCCGNCAWTGCDAFSKALQVKKLRQARSTGSRLLITSCPKCQVHLRCAMEDPLLGPELIMEITDLTNLIAKTIYWE